MVPYRVTDLLGSVTDESPDLWHEVGEHGQGSHHVEHDEHLAHVGLRIDVTVAHLKKIMEQLHAAVL